MHFTPLSLIVPTTGHHVPCTDRCHASRFGRRVDPTRAGTPRCPGSDSSAARRCPSRSAAGSRRTSSCRCTRPATMVQSQIGSVSHSTVVSIKTLSSDGHSCVFCARVIDLSCPSARRAAAQELVIATTRPILSPTINAIFGKLVLSTGGAITAVCSLEIITTCLNGFATHLAVAQVAALGSCARAGHAQRHRNQDGQRPVVEFRSHRRRSLTTVHLHSSLKCVSKFGRVRTVSSASPWRSDRSSSEFCVHSVNKCKSEPTGDEVGSLSLSRDVLPSANGERERGKVFRTFELVELALCFAQRTNELRKL